MRPKPHEGNADGALPEPTPDRRPYTLQGRAMTATLKDDTLVLADRRLVGGKKRAVYAAHRQGDDWLFCGTGFFDEDSPALVSVPFSRLVEGDPELRQLGDLGPGWHAFRDDPSRPWWSAEMPRGATYVLTYEARPTELVPDRDAIGGAFVICWVVGERLDEARERALRHLEKTGWAVIEPLKEQEVPAKAPLAVEVLRRRAEQQGEVYIINAFPPEEPDA
jgi:hypothetical protein